MLLRILAMGLYPLQKVWVPLLIFVSIITMTGANLAALTQNNLAVELIRSGNFPRAEKAAKRHKKAPTWECWRRFSNRKSGS